MTKAVLFDFDETLQDRTLAFEKYMDTFFSQFFPDIDKNELEKRKEEMRITGNGGYVMANGYKNRDEWYEDLARRWSWSNAPSGAELTHHYDTLFGDHNVIFPNSAKVMQTLKDRGYIVGIVTNGPSGLQHHKLDMSGLREYCDIVVVSGDVGVHKPDPEIFKYVLDKYNLKAENCTYVGDHPINDIECATKAGLNAIRMNWGWFKNQSLRPDIPVIEDIIDVLKYV